MFNKDVDEDARRLVKIATEAADMLNMDRDEMLTHVNQNFPEANRLVEKMARGPPTINFVYPEFPEFQFWCRSGPSEIHVKGRSKYFGFVMTISSKNPADWTCSWNDFMVAKATGKARKLPARLEKLFGAMDVSGTI